jgi:hypothetical protein
MLGARWVDSTANEHLHLEVFWMKRTSQKARYERLCAGREVSVYAAMIRLITTVSPVFEGP